MPDNLANDFIPHTLRCLRHLHQKLQGLADEAYTHAHSRTSPTTIWYHHGKHAALALAIVNIAAITADLEAEWHSTSPQPPNT